MLEAIDVPIIIVSYGSADEVARCLAAIDLQRNAPAFGVFICENGGGAAFDALVGFAVGNGGPCVGPAESLLPPGPQFLRAARLKLAGSSRPVVIAEAADNFGFPGGNNAWLRLFLAERGWKGAWMVNPDTQPEPDALAELVSFAETRDKGMVMSRIMFADRTDVTASRGLKWSRWTGRGIGVDVFAPVEPAPDPDEMERRMDAPTAVSLYVTRKCMDAVGLMDDGYFLYFEEFDWGILAKAACGIGYVHTSVVPHVGGSVTGFVQDRKQRSPLAVYLIYRNRIHFARRRFPGWLPWTVLVSCALTGEFLLHRAPANFVVAWKGILAGLRGEWGKPQGILSAARLPAGATEAIRANPQ